MNRRQFLSFASVPIAAAVVVPELVRTIILPPRGGWPVNWSRYLTHPGAWKPMGWKDVDGRTATLSAAEFRSIVTKDLRAFWCDYYDGKVLGRDGEPIRFAEEWQALYGTPT